MADLREQEMAEWALRIGAIKLNTTVPFQWASGYRMPIYNDNRMFLGHQRYRRSIVQRLAELSASNTIAGTSTAGIPWAAWVSDKLDLPMVYVRDKPKEHGMKNQIEGIDAEKDLARSHVVLIEDLISTGGSSVKAVQAIRNANGTCDNCFSLFSYGFRMADEMFDGKIPYDDKGNRLTMPCLNNSLLYYSTLINVAKALKQIGQEQLEMLEEWRTAPFEWGEKHGFPRVVKDKK